MFFVLFFSTHFHSDDKRHNFPPVSWTRKTAQSHIWINNKDHMEINYVNGQNYLALPHQAQMALVLLSVFHLKMRLTVVCRVNVHSCMGSCQS